MAFNDDTGHYEMPVMLEGGAGNFVRATRAALKYVGRDSEGRLIPSGNPGLGITNNIGFVFYFHTHPWPKGARVPNTTDESFDSPDLASDQDMKNFATFQKATGGVGMPFAVAVSETKLIAYDATHNNLCPVARK